MLFGLFESKSVSTRLADGRRPLKLEELAPRIMLSGTETGSDEPILPPPLPPYVPPPAEVGGTTP